MQKRGPTTIGTIKTPPESQPGKVLLKPEKHGVKGKGKPCPEVSREKKKQRNDRRFILGILMKRRKNG